MPISRVRARVVSAVATLNGKVSRGEGEAWMEMPLDCDIGSTEACAPQPPGLHGEAYIHVALTERLHAPQVDR